MSGNDAREEEERRAFEQALEDRQPWIWVTMSLVAANVVVYAACFAFLGSDPSAYELIEVGSNFGFGSARGEPWRLVTSLFLHANIAHLALNMLALADVGQQCERLFGRVRFLALYLMSGIAGAIVSVTADPLINSVGASGAICGLLGGLLALMCVRTDEVPFTALKSRATTLAALVIYSVGAAATGEPIDHVAHFAGLMAGALCALFLLPERKEKAAPGNYMTTALGLVVFAASAAGLYLNLPEPPPERVTAWLAERNYAADVKWFTQREYEIIAAERELSRKANLAETKPRLRELAGEWQEVHGRFVSYTLSPERDDVRRMLAEYADLKAQAYRALAEASPADGREPAAYKTLMHQAKLVEFALRAALYRM